jgi:cytochrome oxidase Cu insertion factor (SCO1/SenC/PrrC family)
MLLYFGFTWCPDVCPTELGTMAAALDAMGKSGEAVVPVLITVDPERDGPAQLADYVGRFHPRLIGLTGTPEQVAEALADYHALGVSTFLIRGFDPLDDAVAYGRDLLPATRAAVAVRRDPAAVAA